MPNDGIVDEVAVQRVLDGKASPATLTVDEKRYAVRVAWDMGWSKNRINRELSANRRMILRETRSHE